MAQQKELWLNAFYDPLANLRTMTSNIRLADLSGDGDSKLCICDLDKKFKIFKGTAMMMEYALLDVPVAMCVTYTEVTSVSKIKRMNIFPAVH